MTVTSNRPITFRNEMKFSTCEKRSHPIRKKRICILVILCVPGYDKKFLQSFQIVSRPYRKFFSHKKFKATEVHIWSKSFMAVRQVLSTAFRHSSSNYVSKWCQYRLWGHCLCVCFWLHFILLKYKPISNYRQQFLAAQSLPRCRKRIPRISISLRLLHLWSFRRQVFSFFISPRQCLRTSNESRKQSEDASHVCQKYHGNKTKTLHTPVDFKPEVRQTSMLPAALE